jgi:hypothetical protein
LAGILGVLLLLLVAVLPLLGKLIPRGLSFALVGLSFWLMVGGFFSWAESLLKNSTKSDIAVWLLGVKVGQKVEPWPGTFAKVFDRVFGAKHLSLRCFLRSTYATVASCALCSIWLIPRFHDSIRLRETPLEVLGSACLLSGFDYASLIETRFLLGLMRRLRSPILIVGLLLIDGVLTGTTGLIPSSLLNAGVSWSLYRKLPDRLLLFQPDDATNKLDQAERDLIELSKETKALSRTIVQVDERNRYFELMDRLRKDQERVRTAKDEVRIQKGQNRFDFYILWLPTFFTSIWLWLYAGSGFLLKFARRFDKSLGWFNRRFDIEHKPLSSIGLVAGGLMALVYWAAVIVGRVV